jgi:DNA-binding response OmpR family regulator
LTPERTIIVVEDDAHIADLVDLYLREAGFRVLQAPTGERGLELHEQHQPALAVVDVGLPGIDGFEVVRRIRTTSQVPILFLTARDGEVDRVRGLELGADDYVVKPFSPRELVARVKAILRRVPEAASGHAAATLSVDDVELDHAAHAVTVGGEPVELTSREFELLAALLAHPNVVLSRDRLLESAWGGEFPGGTRTVDVHVAQLRRKLERPRLIETVRGVGYKVVP